MSHNATSVYTILRKFIPTLQNENPNLKTVHYLCDSPTSQYRNKTILQFIANREAEFEISGRRSYLESGHGKGPCDGLGACVKRAADNAVKQGKTSIQCAEDFSKWAGTAVEEGSKVNFLSFTQTDYEESEEILSKRVTPLPVKGTFMCTTSLEMVQTRFLREVTCYCDSCRADVAQTKCDGYTLHFLTKNIGQQNDNLENKGKEVFKKDAWVAAMYQCLFVLL